jgi:hypothetical protein
MALHVIPQLEDPLAASAMLPTDSARLGELGSEPHAAALWQYSHAQRQHL